MNLEDLTNNPCGLDKHLGLRYTEVSSTRVSAVMVISEHHLQPAGLVHGGVYAAIAESVGSVLGMAAVPPGHTVVGVSNSTDFLHAVKSGVIDVHGTIVRTGKTTQVLNIEMFNRDRLVARTTLRTIVRAGVSPINERDEVNKLDV